MCKHHELDIGHSHRRCTDVWAGIPPWCTTGEKGELDAGIPPRLQDRL